METILDFLQLMQDTANSVGIATCMKHKLHAWLLHVVVVVVFVVVVVVVVVDVVTVNSSSDYESCIILTTCIGTRCKKQYVKMSVCLH